MARRTQPPDQPALFAAPARRRGRTERAVDRCVRELIDTGELDAARHAPIAAALRVLGHQLDECDQANQAYVAATVARTLTDLLRAAGAMPTAGDPTDAELIASLLADDLDDRDGG